MSSTIIEIVGWYGVVAILGAYALVSFQILSSTDFLFQLLNATGAIGVVLISLSKKNYQPAVLNIIWTLIAIVAIIKIVSNK